MSLVNCLECSHKVSDKATLCPNCGYPIAAIKNRVPNDYINTNNDSKQDIFNRALALKNSNESYHKNRAIQLYKYIIDTWPDSQEAVISLNCINELDSDIEKTMNENGGPFIKNNTLNSISIGLLIGSIAGFIFVPIVSMFKNQIENAHTSMFYFIMIADLMLASGLSQFIVSSRSKEFKYKIIAGFMVLIGGPIGLALSFLCIDSLWSKL